MCGIVSLVYKDENPELGREAVALLKRLEYRGYDSTGAAFIDRDRKLGLMKKAGPPSRVCAELRVQDNSGQRFIGQVRRATCGAVTDANSQPHRVRCKVEMVGAHNGNISNADSLRPWLVARGHAVASDNDGEIIVHLVEENYSVAAGRPGAVLPEMRQAFSVSGLKEGAPDCVFLMIDAIRRTAARAEGSFAAAIADPEVPGVFAIKSGSSLYAGLGADARGEFIIVSSDLTSVLSKTRSLIPLAEGEGLWFTERRYMVFSLRGACAFSVPRQRRSKLSVSDTALDPCHRYYMEQEILASPVNIGKIIRYYFRDPADEALAAAFEDRRSECKAIADAVAELSDRFGQGMPASGMEEALAGPDYAYLRAKVAALGLLPEPEGRYRSDEARLLSEFAREFPARCRDLALLDRIFIWRKRRSVLRHSGELKAAIAETLRSGGKIYLVACGTSYNAALAAACFFGDIAGIPVFPCNPGMFRSMYLSSLTAEDFIFGITQSGETKDLVDIFIDAKAKVPGLRRACLVNNENSRIPQELSDFYLPVLCGPEIAVAATKSFTNQLAVLYLIASGFTTPERQVVEKLGKIQSLLSETIDDALCGIETVARRLFLKPSIHILGTSLIGLAREGALKIREVVLNHSEGIDTAEFKHGPNTILGKNTLFSAGDVTKAIDAWRETVSHNLDPERTADTMATLAEHPEILESLFSGYPLIFICPPEERDARITVSQIHTHKIRGSDIILIAERRQDLSVAVEGRPGGDEGYWSKYIEVPFSGDRNIFVFSATIVLQYLAYRMSVLKMEWLDCLNVADHGVHPDVPKNVSKSITVD